MLQWHSAEQNLPVDDFVRGKVDALTTQNTQEYKAEYHAPVAESVDALDLKSNWVNRSVPVQVWPGAFLKTHRMWVFFFRPFSHYATLCFKHSLSTRFAVYREIFSKSPACGLAPNRLSGSWAIPHKSGLEHF